jgi:hypothetical protein
MQGAQNGRDAGAVEEAGTVGPPEEGRPGGPPQAPHTIASLVLPCPLVVLGTTPESQKGRPLGDLLRRIAYL